MEKLKQMNSSEGIKVDPLYLYTFVLSRSASAFACYVYSWKGDTLTSKQTLLEYKKFFLFNTYLLEIAGRRIKLKFYGAKERAKIAGCVIKKKEKNVKQKNFTVR